MAFAAFVHSHRAAGCPFSQPNNEIRQRRRAAQFPQSRRVLPAMVVAVHRRLRQTHDARLILTGGLNQGSFDKFLEFDSDPIP